MKARMVCIAACGVLAGAPAMAETFRCGSSLISEATGLNEIIARCGQPVNRTSRTEEIRAPVRNSAATTVRGTTTTEEWTFSRGASAPPFIVTIVDGKVRSVARAP